MLAFIKQQTHNQRVPDFPEQHVWLNSEPIALTQLKGKLVCVDFWTYCCINCLHVLPDMDFLERKYAEEKSVVFLGCHSAKFLNEKESSKVRDAVIKYEIKHPVINDD